MTGKVTARATTHAQIYRPFPTADRGLNLSEVRRPVGQAIAMGVEKTQEQGPRGRRPASTRARSDRDVPERAVVRQRRRSLPASAPPSSEAQTFRPAPRRPRSCDAVDAQNGYRRTP